MKRLIGIAIMASQLTLTAWAQEVQDQPQDQPAQWQLTMEVIKKKADDLLVKNNQLVDQNQALNAQIKSLSDSIKDGLAKNEELKAFLRERRGRTDSQMQLDDLNTQIKDQRGRMMMLNKAIDSAQRKVNDLDRKIKLKKLKISEIQIHQTTKEVEQSFKKALETPPDPTVELDGIRKQLEEAKSEESSLEQQLNALKSNSQEDDLKLRSVEAENKSLEDQLDQIQKENARITQNAIIQAQQNVANAQQYHKMMAKKQELEAQIQEFENKVDRLKDPSLYPEPWDAQKKKLVREISDADARNNELRDKIKALHEDVGILQDQVGKLQHMLEISKGPSAAK